MHPVSLKTSFIRALLLALLAAAPGCAHAPTDHPYRIRHEYSVSDPQFRRTIGNLLGSPIVEGNVTTTLVNGDRIFPAMLDAIRSAKKTINFESYVYWSGQVGDKFAAALSERAAAGVKVHVMIDSVGSGRIAPHLVAEMKHAGVEV